MLVEKKKRGRKPKNESLITTPQNEINTPPENKKRGRKPKNVYSSIEYNNIHNPNIYERKDDNIIVQLNIGDKYKENGNNNNLELNIDISKYTNTDTQNPIPPGPYAYNADTCLLMDYKENKEDPPDKNPRCCKHDEMDIKVVNLLRDFVEKNKNNEWPINTSNCCYWCSENFENSPYGIPINYERGHFYVYGCFCSLECAASYNFNENKNVDEMWERYNLINFLNRKLGLSNIVYPSPDRLSLKKFGGHLTIEKFREFSHSKKIINTNFPPMTALTQQIVEINMYDLDNDMRFIALDMDRVNRYKARLNMINNKPLDNSSIENTMGLKYSTT